MDTEKKKKRRPRRFNGTGAVWKMQGRRRQPWIARANPESDENGEPIYIYSYHETAFDADKAIPQMEKEYWESKNRNPFSADTVAQVWERYKLRIEKKNKNTAKGYGHSYAHWSALHGRSIAELLTRDLQELVDEKESMSFSTLSKMKSIMVSIFNEAAKDDIVKRNYASLIELPKSEPTDSRRSFTDEEMQKIQKTAFDGMHGEAVPYADVILLMCCMGWRPTEMCELKPENVDIENWIITGGIKTAAGKQRRVPVYHAVRPIVERWLKKGCSRLITNELGEPLTKDTWRTRYYNAMEKMFGEVEGVPPYTTRHTCASMLFACGADKVTIARIMGHKDYKITNRVYTHVQLRELMAAVDTLDKSSLL